MKKTLIAIFLLLSANSIFAKASINDMQQCQALINFIQNTLQPIPDNYTEVEVSTVLKGLTAYDNYIQKDIINPGLLAFNKNDQAKADAMQKQIDAYKTQVTKAYGQRYPQKKLFTDHAVALNECAKKSAPKGEDLTALKASLEMIMSLAKKG